MSEEFVFVHQDLRLKVKIVYLKGIAQRIEFGTKHLELVHAHLDIILLDLTARNVLQGLTPHLMESLVFARQLTNIMKVIIIHAKVDAK